MLLLKIIATTTSATSPGFVEELFFLMKFKMQYYLYYSPASFFIYRSDLQVTRNELRKNDMTEINAYTFTK